MFTYTNTFSSFSVDDLETAKAFYSETLGVDVREEMGLQLHLEGGQTVFVYPKDDHQPATFTILNFVVEDIESAVADLKSLGVRFEHYDLGNGAVTDEKGILRGKAANRGPDIAWFKDPAGMRSERLRALHRGRGLRRHDRDYQAPRRPGRPPQVCRPRRVLAGLLRGYRGQYIRRLPGRRGGTVSHIRWSDPLALPDDDPAMLIIMCR